MKLPKNCKLEKVTSKDKTRTGIGYVCIDGTEADNPVAVACDGRILAVIPIELGENDDLTGDRENGVRLIPASALPAARKNGKGVAEVLLNGGAELPDGTVVPTQREEKYPNWRQVDRREHREGTSGKLYFSPHLLLALAEGIGIEKGNGIEVDVNLVNGDVDPSQPLLVRNKANGAHGVLMTIRQD